MINSTLSFDKQKYIQKSLINLNELSDDEIKKQLEYIAEHTKNDRFPIYSLYEYDTDIEGKEITKIKEYQKKDGKDVANTIISRLFSFIKEEESLILNKTDDLLDVCDTLKTIENSKIEEQDKALENLDKRFKYLLDVPAYSSIYIEFRKDYLKLLEKHLRSVYSKNKLEEENRMYWLVNGNRPAHSHAKALKKHAKYKPERKI